MESLSTADARRLALARSGLLRPELTQMSNHTGGEGTTARAAALAIIRRFGYLQLDTIAIAGARSHVLVLLSRLRDMKPALGEQLLVRGAPLFEYWGHEASWIPLELYPHFEFRRRAFQTHPWWGDVIKENKQVANRLRRRIRDEGPLRSVDMEGPGSSGWWDFKIAKRVATALWSSGELAIAKRHQFIRTYDLTERVIPNEIRARKICQADAFKTLLLRALAGHGWATRRTLASTWRLKNVQKELVTALAELAEAGLIHPCTLAGKNQQRGWIRPQDLELLDTLRRLRPFSDSGVLLSPFDPVLWDRARVQQLFGFEQSLESFKPASKRMYGYYCLPVLAGEKLLGRVDLKARRKEGLLEVLSRHFESKRPAPPERKAMTTAIHRLAKQLDLRLTRQVR